MHNEECIISETAEVVLVVTSCPMLSFKTTTNPCLLRQHKTTQDNIDNIPHYNKD